MTKIKMKVQSPAGLCTQEMQEVRGRKHLCPARCKDTHLIEMLAFFGVMIFRGLSEDMHVPLTELWYDDLGSKAFYRASLPLYRFQWIQRCITLHIYSEGDKFARLRWLYNRMDNRFQACYTLSEDVCLDETFVNFYARSDTDLKVYNPDKPGRNSRRDERAVSISHSPLRWPTHEDARPRNGVNEARASQRMEEP